MEPVVLMDKKLLTDMTCDCRRPYADAEIQLIDFPDADLLTASGDVPEDSGEVWSPWA